MLLGENPKSSKRTCRPPADEVIQKKGDFRNGSIAPPSDLPLPAQPAAGMSQTCQRTKSLRDSPLRRGPTQGAVTK